jgi:hypothetical protein
MVAQKLKTMKQERPEKDANLHVSRADAANVARRVATQCRLAPVRDRAISSWRVGWGEVRSPSLL